ncbi:MAG: hypothetical protein FWE33_05405 [Defluviitaleaceae bacterium]|nr:hypothetical protein [Defluviitaleaceae bacterium]
MFTKILKYDFMFSYKTFFTMAAALIILAISARLTGLLPNVSDEATVLVGVAAVVMVIFIVAIVAIIIAAYIQILLMYHRNFFSAEGYLTLTLPVARGKLLASKFITSMAWFNFSLLISPIVVIILASMTWEQFTNGMSSVVNAMFFLSLIEANLVAIALISILFLTVTLANTVVFGKKIHGIIAGIFAALAHILFFYVFGKLKSRSFELSEITMSDNMTAFRSQPQVGLEFGRIPFEVWEGGYIDIFSAGFVIGFAALCIVAILYLLKKRIALR